VLLRSFPVEEKSGKPKKQHQHKNDETGINTPIEDLIKYIFLVRVDMLRPRPGVLSYNKDKSARQIF